MNDLMTFPYSVEEFMERYKIVDTDGIYMSKGAELVPIFRMRQWFEHLPSAQRTGRWIPVSERLPEEADGTVLVCMPNESPYNEREQFINAKHNQQVETAHYSQYSDTWYFAMGAVSETRPIAWMPLPPVYREAEKRENERSNV